MAADPSQLPRRIIKVRVFQLLVHFSGPERLGCY
jgi:hypothetical protein